MKPLLILTLATALAAQVPPKLKDAFVPASYATAISRPLVNSRIKTVANDPAGTNAKLKLLFIGCGRQDSAFRTAQSLDASLTKANIRHTFFEMDGVHNYIVWRRCFEETATQLFR